MPRTVTKKRATRAQAPSKLEGWELTPKHTKATRVFTFDKHITAVVFLARVAIHEAVLDIHPVITIQGPMVTIVIGRRGGLTKADEDLAERIVRTVARVVGG